MAVTLSSGLQALVDAAPRTKTGYSEALRDGLGNTRRLILSKDGTVFLNVGMSGPMTLSGGNITGFGVASGVTVRQAVDLLDGGGILRIEGNGHSYQATIGLSRAAQIAARVAGGMTQSQAEAAVVQYDYYLPANPTTTSGYGFDMGAKIKAPRFYSSGTGPAAPPIAASTPTIIELVDWSNPANPVVVGTATFNVRKDDWVYENPTMAAEIGDVALYTVNDSIKWTTPAANERFELGGLLMIAANYNTENGTQQLEQMLLSFKPLGRWNNYPFMDGQVKWTYDANGVCTNPTAGDYTYPPPFKINLYTTTGYKNGAADRTPLYTHEIKAFNDKAAGPINGPQWSQKPTDDEPCVPHFNCAQMLPWQNMRTRRSSKATQYVAGFLPLSLSGTANDTASCNPAVPLFNEGGQQNSGNHFYAMPKWPLKNAKAEKYSAWDTTYMANYWPTTPDDPKLFRAQQVYWPDWQYSGYAWQPGSVSGHDWQTGNGGMRFDRYVLPSVLAHWCTDPGYVRPQGAVPIRDMVDGWGFAYFNHSNHWMRDVVNFEYLPRQYALDGHSVFANAYYGGGPYGALGQPMGPDKTVDLSSLYAPNKDPKGRFMYGGWRPDGLHAHRNAGFYAMILNSPMHSIAQMHDFHTLWMSNLGSAGPAPSAGPNANLDEHLFQYRTQAWRWLGYVITWTNATPHPWGFTQAELEARFALELEKLYDEVYKPAFIDNNTSAYFTAIRNLGMAVKSSGGNLTSNGGTLGYYMVHTLVLMRQTGLWAKMRNRNTKCRASLDMFIYCYDKQIVEYGADTKMRGAYYPLIVLGKTSNATAADIPASWAAYDAWLDSAVPPLAASTPDTDSESPERWIDLVTRYNGRGQEVTGHPYFYYQYMLARRDYFPENPPAKLQAAITKYEGFMAKYDQLVAQDKAYPRKNLHPPQGALLPPPVVGPNE